MNHIVSQHTILEERPQVMIREAASEASAPNEAFARLLQSAVEEVITGILGQKVRERLYLHLGEQYRIAPEELPNRLDILREVLERALGTIASATIERAIARNLYGKLGIQFHASRGCELPYYVAKAKTWLALQD